MHEEQWPEEFFGVWVRSNRRRWIEAAKSEMKGWFDNDAIEIVLFMNNTKNECKVSDLTIAQIADIGTKVLHEAAFVRLRNMTNESASMRAGFSELQLLQYVCDDIIDDVVKNHTWIEVIHGYDAICGYLQKKEQFDIYAYLPTHEGYSSLEYGDIAFLKIFGEQGMDGIQRFARNHKKQYRANPEKAHKCKASIYGNLSAGAEFEKLTTSVHTQTCGMSYSDDEWSSYIDGIEEAY
jgi:hypothetical protein